MHNKVRRRRKLDSNKMAKEHQLALYTLLPATKRPEVYLLKQALKEMHEHYDKQEFVYHITWFTCIMDRTKTMSDEEKHIIEEVLQVQYQIDPLIRENPRIRAIAAEGEAKGLAKGLAKGRLKARTKAKIKDTIQHLQK